MAVLTDEIKRAIVIGLAQFRGYQEVAKEVSSQFDVRVERNQVYPYDPTRDAFEGGEKLRVLFQEARTAYLKDATAVPCADQGYRLNMLQRQIDRADRQGNTKLVAELLEQAAKETNGMFTNQRHHHHTGAIAHVPVDPGEARAMLAAKLHEMADKAKPALPAPEQG